MERILSQEERIKRAEEIYYRRNQNKNCYYPSYREYIANDSTHKGKKLTTTKKMLIQITICVLIYLVTYAIQSSEQIISQNIINKMTEILSYDIGIENIKENISNIENTVSSFFDTTNNETLNEENQNEQTNIEENSAEQKNETEQSNEVEQNDEKLENMDTTSQTSPEQNIVLAVGGAEEEQQEERTQDDLDVEYIKSNYSIIWPLQGTITSGYGPRTPTEIVTANHYGLDIGGDTGAEIVAAMDGTVTLVSTEGDYGMHIQIQNEDITTVYAHCSLLCVEEGQQILQGQKIAEVGQTGRATGPHLHFEIRRDGRTINPEKVLD